MSQFDTIAYNKKGGIASISFNRPEVRNAFNTAMRDALYQVLEAVTDDPDVKVVVLRGEGLDFCAGADLTEFGTAPSLVTARAVRWERDLWGLFLRTYKPLIARIHGHCLGSGLEIALLCDLRIASQDALFAMPEARLGLIAAAGGTQTLPRCLGPSRSLQLLLTGRQVGAEEALDLGLVTRVVPRKALDEETHGLAQLLAALDLGVVRAAKQALRQGPDLPLAQALELEARLALSLAPTGAR